LITVRMNKQSIHHRLSKPIAVVAGALALAVSFPAWDHWYLAWIALVPLIMATVQWYPERKFIIAWLFATISYSISFSWVTYSIVVYGGLPMWIAGFALLVMAAILAIFVALSVTIAECIHTFSNAKVPRLFIWPVCWVTMEYVRANLPLGLAFPWNSLGKSQHSVPWLLQNADWGSFYGLSFLIVFANCGVYSLITKNSEKNLSTMLLPPVIVLALLYGAFRYSTDYGDDTIRVGIVQGNVDLHEKWDPAMRFKTLSDHIHLSKKLMPQQPQLFVWAESSIPFNYRYAWFYENGENGALGYHLETFIETTEIPLLTGTLDIVDDDVFNAVVLALPDGSDTYFYKQRLVPFGEFVPLNRILFFVNRLVEDQIGQFTPGSSVDPLAIPGGPKIAVTICYENIFPELVRKRVRAGADLICNVTNDAWFGETSASYQHFSVARFRAVETRRAVVRSANSGISGAIDSRGRILQQTDLFTKSSFVVDVSTDHRNSPYVIIGNTFAAGCMILTVVLYLAVAILRRKQR
jgi:apolipoprotein N-acyltransferase